MNCRHGDQRCAKRCFRFVARALLGCLVCIPGIGFAQGTTGLVNLTGRVVGGSGHSPIYVALWDASGFLKQPVRQIRIEPGSATDFAFQVARGRWALSAFEDENGNGRLDMGAFGPKEPAGFWRSFHGWHKPRFDDVSTAIDKDTQGVEIRLGN
jgi:hypothetical protein